MRKKIVATLLTSIVLTNSSHAYMKPICSSSWMNASKGQAIDISTYHRAQIKNESGGGRSYEITYQLYVASQLKKQDKKTIKLEKNEEYNNDESLIAKNMIFYNSGVYYVTSLTRIYNTDTKKTEECINESKINIY